VDLPAPGATAVATGAAHLHQVNHQDVRVRLDAHGWAVLTARPVRRDGRVQVIAFYTYDGSLTTPGCTENVRWSVLAGGGQVSNAAVTRFHEVISRFPGYGGYPNNNRPLQPLNRRVVQLRRGRHED
jgi:hypothetical protein